MLLIFLNGRFIGRKISTFLQNIYLYAQNKQTTMENLLHYVWKYRLYSPLCLKTTCGEAIEVIDPGIPNTNAGPDFFNAKIVLDGTVWAGCVEIHTFASDWILHHHDQDRAYDAVVLHVVESSDCETFRTNGEQIPQLVLEVPPAIRSNIAYLLERDTPVPCLYRLPEIDPVYRTMWLDALLSERLERKTQDICLWLEHSNGDWNSTFYIALCRNFGFGINNDAFEWLAKSLPLQCILKQRGSASQIEAMFFGQAGLLKENIENDHYYRLLQQEYKFLQYKFGLKPLDSVVFKRLRLRPGATPHLKLAQLAAFWIRYDSLFPALLEARTPSEVKKFFRIAPSGYWRTHYHFGTESSGEEREKTIGKNAVQIILINTVVPMFFAYGLKRGLPEYTARALGLLETIPGEKNNLVETFRQIGFEVRHAGDSQALIQLRREYCEKKKCLYCRFGFQLLKKGKDTGG